MFTLLSLTNDKIERKATVCVMCMECKEKGLSVKDFEVVCSFTPPRLK